MENIQVSLVASAIRTQHWEKFLNSLKGNKVNIEVIFVGPRKPDFDLTKYPHFKYIEATTKPCQCYQIGFFEAKGELVGWTADDAVYDLRAPDNIDSIYNFYKSFNDDKVVVAQRPIEDGRDIWYRHHFFGDWNQTPIMAPLGFMSRDFLNRIGGYDRNFISGQAENDICMRAIEAGGKVVRSMDSYVHVFHQICHEKQGPQSSGMRKYYVADREVLENAWVVGGYGAYGKGGQVMRAQVRISRKRLKPVESFENNDTITTVTQGPRGLDNPPWS